MIPWAGKQERIHVGFLNRLWMLAYPMLLYLGVGVVVMVLYLLIYTIVNPPVMKEILGMGFIEPYDYSSLMEVIYKDYMIIALLNCLLTIPFLYLFMRLDRKREMRCGAVLEQWERVRPWAYPLVILAGIGSCVVLNHLLIFSGLYSLLGDEFEEMSQVLYGGNLWLEIFVVGMVVPLTEELIFRGLVYRRLRWFLDPKGAIILSALLFGVFHGNMIQGIYAFAIGVLLAFVYERYHHLAAPVAVHAGANIMSVLLSDSRLFDEVYESDAGFFGMTLVMMVLLVLVLFLILTRVRPARIKQPDTSSRPLWPSEEERNGERTF